MLFKIFVKYATSLRKVCVSFSELNLNDDPFSRWTDNDLSMGTTHTGIFSANDVCINSTTFIFVTRLKNMFYT